MGPKRSRCSGIPGLPLVLAVLSLPLIVIAASGCHSNAPSAAAPVAIVAAEVPVFAGPETISPFAPAVPLRRYHVPSRVHPVLPFRPAPGLPPRLEPRDFAAPSAPYVYVLPENGVFAMSPFESPRIRIVPNRAMPSVPMPTTPGFRGVEPIPLLEMHGYPGGIPPVPMPALDSSSGPSFCSVPSTSGR